MACDLAARAKHSTFGGSRGCRCESTRSSSMSAADDRGSEWERERGFELSPGLCLVGLDHSAGTIGRDAVGS